MPVLVKPTGGPEERIRPGISGCAASSDGEFFQRIEHLPDDARLRSGTAHAARAHAEALDRQTAADGLSEMHARLVSKSPEAPGFPHDLQRS